MINDIDNFLYYNKSSFYNLLIDKQDIIDILTKNRNIL